MSVLKLFKRRNSLASLRKGKIICFVVTLKPWLFGKALPHMNIKSFNHSQNCTSSPLWRHKYACLHGKSFFLGRCEVQSFARGGLKQGCNASRQIRLLLRGAALHYTRPWDVNPQTCQKTPSQMGQISLQEWHCMFQRWQQHHQQHVFCICVCVLD